MLECLSGLTKIKSSSEVLRLFIINVNGFLGNEVIDYSVNHNDNTDSNYVLSFNGMSFGYISFDSSKISSEQSKQLSVAVEFLSYILFNNYKSAEADVSTHYFQRLINAIPNPIFFKDNDGKYIGFNSAFEKLIGLKAEEIEGKTVFDISTIKSNAEFVAKKDRELLKDEVVQTYETQIELNSGEKRFVRFDKAVFYFEDGTRAGIVGILTDINQRRIYENKLKIFSKAFEQSSVSIIITDINGEIEYINPAVTKTSQYTSEDLMGKNPRVFKSGKTSRETYESLWNNLLAGKVWKGELLNKKKNGDLFWEENIISPVKNSEGKVIKFVALKHDVTERKRLISELEYAKEEAEKANKLKSEFLAQVSHEIRTPVNTLLSLSQVIEEESINFLDKDLIDCFPSMQRAGKRIIRTIDLILNLSQLQIGSIDFSPEEFGAEYQIKYEILPDMNNKAKEKGLRISLISETDVANIFADRYMFNQIFINLIDNAIKYTITGEIKIIIRKNEDGTCISVEDTGIGISEEFLPQLFKEFSQEEQGYTRSFEGNGLGLALVKKYCEKNNATISVESKKNKGTKFSVVF